MTLNDTFSDADAATMTALARGLTDAGDGFSLWLVEAPPVRHAELARRLAVAMFASSFVHVELRRDAGAIVDQVARVEASGPVMVTGFEPLADAGMRWTGLNMSRPRWDRDIHHPVVFWVSSRVLGDLMRGAPDFFDWRSGSYAFDQPVEGGELPAATSKDEHRFRLDGTVAEALARIEELRPRIAPLPEGARPQLVMLQAGALREMSEIEASIGRYEDARRHAEASVAAWEAIRERSTGSDRELYLSRFQLGVVLHALGELHAARTQFEHCLELCRTIRTRVGDTPETLRDVSISLERTADVLLALGEPQAARERYEESLEICRTIRTRIGDTPQTLRDVSVSLNRTADVLRALGEPQAARERYEESLELRRTIRTRVGDTPETLRDVSVSLTQTADVLLAVGEPQAARERYEKSLEISRTIRTRVGDTPETLRDVSISLNRTADVLLALGEPQAARERYEESLALARTIRTRIGDTPDTVRDVMVSLFKLAEVTVSSDRSNAIKTVREAHDLTKNLVGRYPAISQHQADLNEIEDFAETHALGNLTEGWEAS